MGIRRLNNKAHSQSEAPFKEGTGGVGIEHQGCRLNALFLG